MHRLIAVGDAIALCRSAGYGDIGPFADYPEDSTSVFLEKLLITDT